MDTHGQGTRRKAGVKGLNGLEWGGAMEEGGDVESQNARPTQWRRWGNALDGVGKLPCAPRLSG